MKKFSIFILALVVAIAAVDRLVGAGLWWVEKHTNATLARKTHVIAHETEADMVVLGTSRAYHHYDPRILNDTLGISVYNGGLDATENIYSHYIALALLLERHRPKYVCLDLYVHDFVTRYGLDPYKSIIKFAPYYGISAHADSVINLDPQHLAYEVSHIYRYNNQLLTNLAGLVSAQKEEYQGFDPMAYAVLHHSIYNDNYTSADIDSAKIEWIHKFIRLCRTHEVEPILVTSPLYTTIDTAYYAPLRKIAAQHGVLYLDYHTANAYSADSTLFRDYQHLNCEGARLFSRDLAHDLKEAGLKK